MKKLVNKVAKATGYKIVKSDQVGIRDDIRGVSLPIKETVDSCMPYSLTSRARMASLCEAAEYVVKHSIPGSFVECGVYKGGSCMAAAKTFLRLDRNDIDLYLYDTFEGMPEPSDADVNARTGAAAADTYQALKGEGWCESPMEEVQRNMGATGYPAERLHYVKGMVEETIPDVAPETISILRLDTDWYESTKHEMEHLFPRLARGGVLIIDDYGHWAGARKAVDEYLATHKIQILLHRVDYTARQGVKL